MTSPVVTREQAGLRPVSGLPTNITPGAPNGGVTVHYAGQSPATFPWDHSRCASIWRAFQAYHMDHNHWLDIAYSAGVCPHSFIFQGRWWHHRSAANGTDVGNQISYAIVYFGGGADPFTDEAKLAMWDAIALARDDGSAGFNVWPHHKWLSTSCPGTPVQQWLDAGMPIPSRPSSDVPPHTVDPPPAHPVLAAPIVAIAPSPSGRGYLEIGADGGVFAYGDAGYHGSLGGKALAASIIGGAIAPSNGGYWLVAADGGVFAFGDAPFKGSMGGKQLQQPIVGMAASPTGAGYWMVAADGGIFSFGDAPFVGSAT